MIESPLYFYAKGRDALYSDETPGSTNSIHLATSHTISSVAVRGIDGAVRLSFRFAGASHLSLTLRLFETMDPQSFPDVFKIFSHLTKAELSIYSLHSSVILFTSTSVIFIVEIF